MEYKSPLEMLYHWEQTAPDKVYLRQPHNGSMKEWTWKQTGEEVRKLAGWLKSQDLPAGSNIAIISKNCNWWIICDLAIMMAGHVSIPMYPNLSSDTVRLILDHSEAKIAFIGKLDTWDEMSKGIPEGLKCVSFPVYEHPEFEIWDQLVKDVKPVTENVVRDPMEMATIIYTSGTTGMPKGVMHKFHNFSFATTNALRRIPMDQTDRFFSYLPLCHIAERFLVEMGSLYSGGVVSFAESLDTFAQNLSDTKPTVFLGVPRIWSKFQQGIFKKLPPKKLSFLLKIPIINNVIRKKIQATLGLGETRNIFTGAAPTPVSIIDWYAKLGIHIQEAYAMTENCCYSHATLPDNIKVGYVGQPLPQCDVKLSDIDEILIKHEALMDGYYKEPGLTAEALQDGFLYTGDKGEIDPKGFLKITGRVKDLFKTEKAKYVAPAPIELKMSANTNIDQICVVGVGLPQPIGLLNLSEVGQGMDRDELIESLTETLTDVNMVIDKHERLTKLIVLNEAWTPENGFLTPTMKVKRNVIEDRFSPSYDKWYADKNLVIFEG